MHNNVFPERIWFEQTLSLDLILGILVVVVHMLIVVGKSLKMEVMVSWIITYGTHATPLTSW